MIVLAAVVRDREMKCHIPGETLEILTKISRIDNDERPLISVKFSDGSKGTVFPDEITEEE